MYELRGMLPCPRCRECGLVDISVRRIAYLSLRNSQLSATSANGVNGNSTHAHALIPGAIGPPLIGVNWSHISYQYIRSGPEEWINYKYIARVVENNSESACKGSEQTEEEPPGRPTQMISSLPGMPKGTGWEFPSFGIQHDE